jgi:hypothetical protein
LGSISVVLTGSRMSLCPRLISETSLSLLGLTMLASMLHLLFEFLAFQSDITFWKENKSLAGLSTRTLVTDLVSQIIVFLFLVDNAASLLVTVPTAFGLLVQAWKVNIGLCTLCRHVCPARTYRVGARSRLS